MTRRTILVALISTGIAGILVTGYTGTEAGFTDYAGLFIGIAYGWAATSFAVLLAFLLDRYLFADLDTWGEIERGNRSVAIFASVLVAVIVLSMTLVQVSIGQVQRGATPTEQGLVLDTARADLGATEHPPGSNAGPVPRRCLAHVGLGEGYPYCAACVSDWTSAAGARWPASDGKKINSAATRHFRSADCMATPGQVLRGQVVPDSGAAVVWQKGNGPYGHAGILVRMDGRRCFYTIEPNTTPGAASTAEERDGGGVYRRHRCLHPSSYFSVTAFALPPHQC